MNKRAVALCVSALAFVAAQFERPALAGSKDFVVYAPGMGGNSQQAKPYIDTFLRELEKMMGWPAGSADGAYFEDAKQAQEHIDKKQPGLGMLAPPLYMELACQKGVVEPIATVVGVGVKSEKARYHVVVKEGTAADIKALEGKRLASNHLTNLKFVSQVVFGGKYDAEKQFKLLPTNSPVKPFKQVDRGEADAALVDDAQLENMKTLPFGKGLKVIYSSEPLPPFPVAAFSKVVKPAERDQLKKALLGICASPTGGKVCKSLQIVRFEAVDAAAFKSAQALYCK